MPKYLVALQEGGLMEDPEIRYTNKQVIEAASPRQAEEIYNKKNNCSYFYAHCLGKVKGKKITINVEDI